jgi:hypothetical protein
MYHPFARLSDKGQCAMTDDNVDDTNRIIDNAQHIVIFLSKLDAKSLAAATATIAVAFNVGYFYSVDISLFTLFSLSEHIVFAIRALPVALAILITFIIVLVGIKCSHHCLSRELRSIIAWTLTAIWIAVLVTAAVQTGFESHYGLTFSFAVLAGCTFLYVWFEPNLTKRASPQSATAAMMNDPRNPATSASTGNTAISQPDVATKPVVPDHELVVHGTFWASTAIFSAFVIGFFVGKGIFDSQRPSIISLKQTIDSGLSAGPKSRDTVLVGIIIHSSAQNLLLWELPVGDVITKCFPRYPKTTGLRVVQSTLEASDEVHLINSPSDIFRDGHTMMLPWTEITKIELCQKADWTERRAEFIGNGTAAPTQSLDSSPSDVRR